MKIINSKTSKTNGYKVINKGDNYGRNNVLTHEKDMPMIEFYFDEFFISRYYVNTFLKIETGLCLEGGAREYDLNREDVKKVQDSLEYLKLAIDNK